MPIHAAGTAPTLGADSTAYVIVRSLIFTALLLVVGAGVFRHLTLGSIRRRGRKPAVRIADSAAQRAIDIALGASIVLLAAIVARSILTATWAWGWLLQLAATVLVLACYLVVRRTGRGTAWAVGATLFLAVTPMLSGHAMATEHFTGLTVFAGTFHVLGASGWLGTLTMILLAGVPAARQLDPGERGAAVADLVNAFSPAALICAALVLITGTFVAWVHLGIGATLWRSDYGRWLLIKLGVLGIVTGVGAYNWRLVRPALGDEAATRRLQYCATLELALAIAVIVLTAVLVATPLPHQLGTR